MSFTARVPALAPFQIRSFRFQWPADLLASWALEMEAVILGWFVLVSTGSVLALAVFGSLQYLGTLISPLFGMAGDRIGNRTVLCSVRAIYVVVSSALMVLFLAGWASPASVFALATVTGLVRPSDLTMRNLLVGETMPRDYLVPATGVSRMTTDLSRIFGALSGAGLVAALGSGFAYVAVTVVYAVSFCLSLNVGIRRIRVMGEPAAQGTPWHALRQGFAYVWSTPDMLAMMLLAFLVNFAALPFTTSLLAYVAKDVYGLGQTGLCWLIACFAGGALAGSLAISTFGTNIRPARTMLAAAAGWLGLNLVFSWIRVPLWGELLLSMSGFVYSFCMIPMAVMLLRVADPAFRGRVMGVRMLAVYGAPLGLLLSGPLIEHLGFAVTGTLFSVGGIVCTILIGVRWRRHLWHIHADANAR